MSDELQEEVMSTDDAMAAMMSEVEEPTESANEVEPETETDLQADDAEVQAPEPEVFDVSNYDPENKLQFGDVSLTLAEVQELVANRTLPEVLQSRQQELERMQQEYEQRNEKYGFINDIDQPHVFLNGAIKHLVESGGLSLEAGNVLVNAFNEHIIGQNLYDVSAAETRAEQLAKEREFQTQQEQIEQERRAVELNRELVQIESKYGVVSDENKTKALETIQTEYAKTGQLLTLSEAFDKLAQGGAFRKPQKSRAKMADDLRRTAPKSDRPDESAMTVESALNAFYHN